MTCPLSLDTSSFTRSQSRGLAALARGRPALGFSLTELLVVIGIIVLLMGILLVALGKVKGEADETKTRATMTQFLNACTTFYADNGRYPGVIPETVLAANPQITSTENALLDLLGGYRVLAPTDPRTAGNPVYDDYQSYRAAATTTNSLVGPIQWNTPAGDWDLVVDTRKIGEGPVINRKPRAPYFTPGSAELARATYPPASTTNNFTNDIPDLIDAWGQPILYLRQLRERGPLTSTTVAPQFVGNGLNPYIQSTSLAELGNDQNARSIFNTATPVTPEANLGKVLEHGAIAGQARGAICLISAGKDGIYFSRNDGPGTGTLPVDDIVSAGPNSNPKVVDMYDDIRVFGGA